MKKSRIEVIRDWTESIKKEIKKDKGENADPTKKRSGKKITATHPDVAKQNKYKPKK